MGTNQVKFYREQQGLTVKQLSQKANLSINAILQTERASQAWGRTPWPGADQRIAAALGVKLADLFSDYDISPKKHQQVQPLRDTRTPEEIDEAVRLANESLRNPTKIADEYLNCHFEETSPGIHEGMGDFVTWQQLQKRRGAK